MTQWLHRRPPLLAILALASAMTADGAEPPLALHRQIDATIEAAHVGTFAALSNDAEFLRRCYLDLLGRSPTLKETVSFQDLEADNKRDTLIDQLLDSDEFNEFFAAVLDVIFMERRGGVRIPQEEWRSFLREAMSQRHSFADIAAAIVRADGSGTHRGAAKFLVQREVEPNAVTRDIGRIFLGRDLQCAQCHDHPNVDDYLQSEYYGIFAFVSRSYLFEDPAANKKSYVGEKAEGQTEFKSVFSSDDVASTTAPRLLGELVLEAEPRWEGDNGYVVTPTSKTAGIPKFSRRRQLAALLTHPSNTYFAQNAVNRIWAHMMGQGIVDPVDFHHSDNPPSHPALLKKLAERFVEADYDIRFLLREIARSRTYQRSIDHPTDFGFSESHLSDRERQVSAAASRVLSELKSEETQLNLAHTELTAQRERLATIDQAITAAADKLRKTAQSRADTQKKITSLQQRLRQQQEQLKLVSHSIASAQATQKAFPKDKAFAASLKAYQQRKPQLEQAIEKTRTSLEETKTLLATSSQQESALQRDLASLKTDRVGQADVVAESRGAWRIFRRRCQQLETQKDDYDSQLAALANQSAYLTKRAAEEERRAQWVALTANSKPLREELERLRAAMATVDTEITQRQSELDAVQATVSRSHATLEKRRATLAAIEHAEEEARAAAGSLKDANLDAVAKSLLEQRTIVAADVAKHQTGLEEARKHLSEVSQALASERERHRPQQERLAALKQQWQQHEKDVAAAKEALQLASVEHQLAHEELKALFERKFIVRTLKPLTPEQLAGSTIAALGLEARFAIEAENEWNKQNKDKPSEANDAKRRNELHALQRKRVKQVESTYVSLFAAPGGAPQDVFSSTTDQSLFMANDGRVQSWLRPSQGSLLKQLQAMSDPHEVARQLYTSILTRPADEAESAEIEAYLLQREKDRGKAIQELAWGLLTSLEFRFNH